jgi:predicted phosphodiesterase
MGAPLPASVLKDAEHAYRADGPDAALAVVTAAGHTRTRRSIMSLMSARKVAAYQTLMTCELPGCDKMVTPGRSNRKFCSREHAVQSANANKKPTQRDEQMERIFQHPEGRANLSVPEAADGTTIVSLSDMQYPFVDEPMMAAVEVFLRTTKPDVLVFNGDILDAYPISQFVTRPGYKLSFEDECKWARKMLQLYANYAGGPEIYWMDGNHEARLDKEIWLKAKEWSFAINDLTVLLDLENLATAYTRYGNHLDYLGFVFTHGDVVRKHSAYTAKAMFEKYHSSGVSGHTHRRGEYAASDMHEVTHAWYEQGCLCRLDLEYVKGSPNWQPGFMVGTVYDGAVHPQIIKPINGSFVVNGERYKVDPLVTTPIKID